MPCGDGARGVGPRTVVAAPAASAALRLAESARVPVAVHLDHATDEPLVDEALAVGIRSVMFDAAHRTDAENLERTAAVAARAAAR